MTKIFRTCDVGFSHFGKIFFSGFIFKIGREDDVSSLFLFYDFEHLSQRVDDMIGA